MKYILYSFLSAVCCTLFASSDSFESIETQEYQYAVSESTRFELVNQYGDIRFQEWSKDSVAIEIEIILEAKNENLLENLTDRVNIDIKEVGNFLRIETDLVNNSRSFRDIIDGALSFTRDVLEFQTIEVNYFLKVPSYLDIDVKNKYGDIFLPNELSDCVIENSYGDISGDVLYGKNEITLSYGKLLLEESDVLLAKLRNAEMEIDELEELDIDSRNTKIRIDRCESIIIDSYNDDFIIEEASEINGECSGSTIRLELLEDQCSIVGKNSDIKIKDVGEGFSGLFLNLRYSYCNIVFDQSESFKYSIAYNVDDELDILSFDANAETNDLDEETKERFGTINEGEIEKLNIKAFKTDVHLSLD